MAKELVDSEIQGNAAVMFAKSFCPFCKMAKNIFDEIGAKYKNFELEDRGGCG